MTISTYTDLKTAVAAWLKPNTTISAGETALAADYITLAESHFNRTLMHPLMEAEASLTFTNGVADIPADLLNVIKIQMTQSPYNELTPSQADLLAATTGYASGIDPTEYRWVGDEFRVNTYKSFSAAIRYRPTLAALSGSNASNWLLARFPDMYLFRSVIEGDTRLLDDEQIAVVNARYDRALTEFNDWAKLSHMGIIRVRPSAGVA